MRIAGAGFPVGTCCWGSALLAVLHVLTIVFPTDVLTSGLTLPRYIPHFASSAAARSLSRWRRVGERCTPAGSSVAGVHRSMKRWSAWTEVNHLPPIRAASSLTRPRGPAAPCVIQRKRQLSVGFFPPRPGGHL